MDNFAFILVLDIPLWIGTLAVFLIYYQRWAKSASDKLEVDLQARLPQAIFRTTVFFVGVLTICLLANFGVWAFLVVALVMGLIVSCILGAAGPTESGFFLLIAALALREWSFGFPSLILDVAPRETDAAFEIREHKLTGTTGVTSGPLKPAGYARINNTEMPVVADNGLMVDDGVEIVVTRFHNGSLRVKVSEGNS